MTSPITVVERRTVENADKGRHIDVDWQLPGMRQGRKTYRAGSRPWQLIEAHRHDSAHHLLCLTGTAHVYVAGDGRAEIVELLPGGMVEIPAGVAHKIVLMPGGILSALMPATTWLGAYGEVQEVDDGVFTGAVPAVSLGAP